MAAVPPPNSAARRRHDEVRDGVRRATLELVEDASFKDLTVDEIARAAGISRSAFYFYFRDKHDLL
ncbi:MAG: helix-turn-helix transcriptional regulator, partial [Thermoleophilaceae bacterium]|nr:helix-turn-helix transcriptional regulator [Thermoleophilaceae bacterium]